MGYTLALCKTPNFIINSWASKSPWFVRDVQLDIAEQTVRVYLDFEGSQAAFCCPECGQYANLYDRARHTPVAPSRQLPVPDLPGGVACRASLAKQHGILTPQVFWCEPNSRYTALFERFALDVLLATQVQSRAAKLLGLSAEQTAYLMQKAVARGLQRRDPQAAYRRMWAWTRKPFTRDITYATLLTDLDAGRVIDLVQHRTQDATVTLLDTALSTPRRRRRRQSVSMDLWPGFRQCAGAGLCPTPTVSMTVFTSPATWARPWTRRAKTSIGNSAERKTPLCPRPSTCGCARPDTLSDKQQQALNALADSAAANGCRVGVQGEFPPVLRLPE